MRGLKHKHFQLDCHLQRLVNQELRRFLHKASVLAKENVIYGHNQETKDRAQELLHALTYAQHAAQQVQDMITNNDP